MKNINFKFIWALLFAISVIAACQKSKVNSTTPTPVTITKESLAGTYKLTAATTSGISVYDTYLQACQKDDIYKLNADLTAAYVDGGVKCSPPGDNTGTWSLIGTSKIVIIGKEVDIKSYDGKTLVVSGMDNSTGFNLLITLTFTKQ